MRQSDPSSFATSTTLHPQRPTRSVIQRPARSLRLSRRRAIKGSYSVQEPWGQLGSGQRSRRLCQTSLVWHSKQGRLTSSTWRRSFTCATTPQTKHPATTSSHSTCTHSGPFSQLGTSSTVTAARPTRRSHMRIGLDSTRALQFVGVRHLQTGRALVFFRVPPNLDA